MILISDNVLLKLFSVTNEDRCPGYFVRGQLINVLDHIYSYGLKLSKACREIVLKYECLGPENLHLIFSVSGFKFCLEVE